MYHKEHIDLLNEFGMISTCVLMRRYKITCKEAMSILHAIVEDFENVYWSAQEIICIKGREPQKKAKKSKWLDVTKP